MAFAYCLDCGARIYLGKSPQRGQPVDCPRCNGEWEVVSVNPIKLDSPDEMADEDWTVETEPDFTRRPRARTAR